MEDINKVIKSVKETVTVDNIVSLMKDVKVIDDRRLKEEDVRKTLSKMDINKYVDVEEIKKKAQNVAEQSKDTLKDLQEQSSKVITYATESFKDFNMFKVLSKAEISPNVHCARVPQPEIIEKQDHDFNTENASKKTERREEDATKMDGQGKQYDSDLNHGMPNLEVSALQMEDLQKTDM